MNLFPRCKKCGYICWQMAGGEYVCSNPQCQNYDNIVEPVLYDIRKERRKSHENSSDNTKNS